MKRRLALAVPVVIALLVIAITWINGSTSARDTRFQVGIDDRLLADPARIERGRYLAVAGNCESCHTIPGGGFMAGGVAFETDFGTVNSTNITPDPEAGIGSWSADDFLRSMRHGVRPGGEHLYPVFPYTSFTRMTDDDVLDLWAWLSSIPPNTRANDENAMSFPFRYRYLLGAWKAMFLEPGAYEPDASEDDEWNRGAYLVNALAHCGECHSPRNALGAVDAGNAFAGGAYNDRVPDGTVERWSAPNLTASDRGLGSWTHADLTDYLATGRNTFLETFGPMNEVIMNSTRHLARADVSAMAAYLKSLPPIAEERGPEPDERLLGMGRTQYNLHCGTCHLPTGEGDPEMAPRIGKGSLVTRTDDPATLINVILYGPELTVLDPVSTWRNPMDEFRYLLDDDEVAALATFVRHSWGNGGGAVTAAQVEAQR